MHRTDDFVGTGWAFPPQPGAAGGIALVSRDRELEQAMQIILTTYPGEREMRPQFGCRLRDYLFRNPDNTMRAELTVEVRSALTRWEPRVSIEQVLVAPDADRPSTVYIDISYIVKGTNDARNLVFPFYTIPDDGSDY